MSRLVLWGGAVLAVGLIGAWFLQQPPEDVAGWLAMPRPAHAQPAPTPTVRPAPPKPTSGPIARQEESPRPPSGPIVAPEEPPRPLPKRPRRKKCLALTWSVIESQNGVVTMGSVTGQSDPYKGDTPCTASLPLLCLKPGNAPPPKGVESVPYRGWSGAEVAVTQPVLGLEVRSLDGANRMCAAVFGEGWRMGAFPDGGGWGLKAFGSIPLKTRMWVTIADQRANLWD